MQTFCEFCGKTIEAEKLSSMKRFANPVFEPHSTDNWCVDCIKNHIHCRKTGVAFIPQHGETTYDE